MGNHNVESLPVKELIAALLVWIGENSDYKTVAAPRYWMELGQKQIDERAGIRTGDGKAGTLAMYECDSRTLILRSDLDFSRPWEQSILLHELVHHAQCLRHGRYDNLCAAEREAYALQARFLREGAAPSDSAEDENVRHLIFVIDQEPDRICALLGRR